ncbi:MAG: beta-galactosidase [Thermoguttaceae bacterium]|nr:beta-galactosidase [Thermoguttaceae bacterium]
MTLRSILLFLFAPLFTLILCCLPARADDAANTPVVKCEDSPFGVCAHIAFGDSRLDKILQAIREAGIRFVRADFVWSIIENPQGTWDFSRIDATLDEMDKYGLTMLPILDYDTSWSRPVVEHLDAWGEFVRTTVSRYKDRIRYWEIWNEPNLQQFWFFEPNAEEYTKLLVESSRIIHEIDPDLKVVYGGTSGIPYKFIEESFAAGACEAFDVMNIHPYRNGLASVGTEDRFVYEIDLTRELMERYGVGDKPIWITEMGWSSIPMFEEIYTSYPLATLRALDPKKIAVLEDRAYPHSRGDAAAVFYSQIASICPTESITLDQLGTITPEQYETLVLPPGESFPSKYFNQIRDFVARGGTLILSGGVPFYYEDRPDEEGVWRTDKAAAPEDFRRAMRIGWRAEWFSPGTPGIAPIEVTDVLCQAASDPEILRKAAGRMYANRFYTDALLKEGDQMIVLANGVKDDFRAASAVIYQFNSDWKGRIMITGGSPFGVLATESDQGRYLSSAILLSLCAGIEKFFWYQILSSERDPNDKELHFGLTNSDVSPKPAYLAYQALTRAVGEGAGDFQRDTADDIDCVGFRRADGSRGWAVWSPGRAKKARLTLVGEVAEAFDFQGNAVSLDDLLSPEGGTIERGMIYIIGPEELKAEFLGK